MNEDESIPQKSSKQEVNENSSSAPIFPEDKKAPIVEKPKTINSKLQTSDGSTSSRPGSSLKEMERISFPIFYIVHRCLLWVFD